MSDSDNEDFDFFGDGRGCGKCRKTEATHYSYERQLRLLREKVELLEVRNIRLSLECDRLRQDLRDAKFKGRSTISNVSCPPLPDEVLQNIFAFATRVDGGLVSPHWPMKAPERPYEPWVTSSKTRRNIPLVCRKWYAVGLEYLFQHIVILNKLQLSNLLNTFKNIPSNTTTRINWIRGLEFILPGVIYNEQYVAPELVKDVSALVQSIPQGRLHAFAFEDGCCSNERQSYWAVSRIVLDALQHSGRSLKLLHLPCLEGTRRAGLESFLRECHHGGIDMTKMEFPQLHTLSLICTPSRNSCIEYSGHLACDSQIKDLFTSKLPSLRTIYMSWPLSSAEEFDDPRLLLAATNLHTAHLIMDGLLECDELDRFLTCAPQLRRLVFMGFPGYRRHSTPPNGEGALWKKLEEIILVINSKEVYRSALDALHPIFTKIKGGCFPNLQQLVVRGSYPEAYLGYKGILTGADAESWKSAVKACTSQGIDFVEENDVAHYLWRARFATVDTHERDLTEGDTSFDEGQWQDMDSSSFGCDTSSEDNISDSEDGRYRYVAQPDLDYDTDSNSGSDS